MSTLYVGASEDDAEVRGRESRIKGRTIFILDLYLVRGAVRNITVTLGIAAQPQAMSKDTVVFLPAPPYKI